MPATATKFAVVVGKKVEKLATKRNTIRRRVLHQLKKTFESNKNIYGILITKPTIRNKSVVEIESELKHLLDKVVTS